eukprot:3748998-Amphidinium_carterae.1
MEKPNKRTEFKRTKLKFNSYSQPPVGAAQLSIKLLGPVTAFTNYSVRARFRDVRANCWQRRASAPWHQRSHLCLLVVAAPAQHAATCTLVYASLNPSRATPTFFTRDAD